MTISSGMFDVPWWAHALIALALTHLTIASVTIFLHRHQTHRALDLHPVASHLFRFWLWLTTGMVTREWVAVHRKHHAKTETAEDPHSPQIRGIARVLWAGVFLYVTEARDRATLERYGHGTPDDWIETPSLCALLVLRPRPHGICRRGRVRDRSGESDLRAADGLDPVLGGRRDQRTRALLGIPQLPGRGRQHQSLPLGHPDRRRRVPQQSSCATRRRRSFRAPGTSSTSAGCTSASSKPSASPG